MAGLFLTGSSVGLLVHGLLPPSMRAEFNFAGWFVAALPLHFVLLALRWRRHSCCIGRKYAGQRRRPSRAATRVLGPMRREEKFASSCCSD
jgi:di/tricarboxylate transporter